MRRQGALRSAVGFSPFLLVLLLSGLALPSLKASWETDYLVRAWETEDGLPQNSVIAIAQTTDGYIWFGTFNGLARFDGTQFKVLDPLNSKLSSGAIQALGGDREGRLWILTAERDLFVLADGVISPVTLEANAKVNRFGPSPIIETPDGSLLTATSAGVARWDGHQFKDVTDPMSIPLKGPGNVIAVSGGRVWVASGSVIGLIKAGHFEPKFDLRLLPGVTVQMMAPGAGGSLWVSYDDATATRNRQLAFDPATERLHPVTAPFVGGVWCLLEDRERILWAGSNGYGLVTQPPDSVARNLTTKDGLSHDQVRSIFEDREGNLWFGTDGGGVMRVKRREVQTYGKSSGFSDEVIYSVAASGNSVDAGTYSSGVYHLDPSAGAAVPYPFRYSAIRSVLRDRSGSLWVAVLGEGLFCLRGGSWESCALSSKRESNSANCLLEDRAGNLWVGGPLGLGVRQGNIVEPRVLGTTSEAVAVCALAEDPQDVLWAATQENGLYSVRDNEVHHYTTLEGLPSNRLRSLLARNDGTLWVGTADQGLCQRLPGRFITYGMQNGIPARAIFSLVEDFQGGLWIGSDRGIFEVARTELDAFSAGRSSYLRSAVYGMSDGLKTPECSGSAQPAACRTEDGRLWFATIKGLATVDPARLPTRLESPPVQIEEAWVDHSIAYSNEPLPPAARRRLDPREITLPASYRVLEIRYTGLGLASPDQVQFRHQLGSFDPDWVVSGNQRIATYPKLPSGKYLFAATAALRDGPWNPAAATLRIIVLPYWWETAWFRGLAALGVIGLTAGGVRWHTRRKLRQLTELLARQKSISDERARISRDMHDGLGSKLTQVSLLAQTLEHAAPTESSAGQTASRISAISHEILQSMSEVVWAVDPKHDNLESLAEHLVAFAQEHLSLAGITCRIDIPVSLPGASLPPSWRHHLLMAFKEAIQNVVKHASASRVAIRLQLRESNLVLEIHDDGIGLPPKPGSRRGNGIDNMRERIEALRGSLEIESKPSEGTCVRLKLPLPTARA